MTRKECASKAAQVRAEMQKEEAERRYNENPNYCLNCGKKIEINGTKVSRIRKKKFCDRSCAAKYNNRKHPKRWSVGDATGTCEQCGREISYTKKKCSNGYYKRKFCSECLYAVRGYYLQNKDVSTMTLSELKSKASYWVQFRAVITKHARRIYKAHTDNDKCEICGYGHHIDVCHIKSVASFDESTVIGEINKIQNLIGLCPNHHWELDHGIITLRDRLE